MRTRKIAEAHQELADDQPAGEAEGLPEEAGPLLGRARVVCRKPAGERAMRMAQFLDAAGVGNDRLDLLAVADDAGIAQQARDIAVAERATRSTSNPANAARKAGRFRETVSQDSSA